MRVKHGITAALAADTATVAGPVGTAGAVGADAPRADALRAADGPDTTVEERSLR
ncbi:hypothetical protein [Kitasatospora sp. NBC_01539]|uniref:hypothetical protein n=1 Tax=Kitasatospora sp. NBC_01539 TaxID=2903577 RepID=UPI003860278C